MMPERPIQYPCQKLQKLFASVQCHTQGESVQTGGSPLLGRGALQGNLVVAINKITAKFIITITIVLQLPVLER